ncbi:MAG: 2'-5' RNA ligase family protein [Acidimicrobiia bacterium]|nr:2'-5' RNA ligase family protein [Acidimicrobiia bacterium]
MPEAEPIVGEFRHRLDSGAAWGVPAHVTILYPFMPLDLVTPEVDRELEAMFAAFDRFAARLTAVEWFGSAVAYVRPEPPVRFRSLTEAVHDRWPLWPPYGGMHDAVVPHLTIGDDPDAAALTRAAEAVEAQLPLDFDVTEVALFSGTDQMGSWTHERSYQLGSAT